MPLLRIETRPKEGSDGGRKSSRRGREQPPRQAGALGAVAAGIVVGLVVVALAATYLVRGRSAPGPSDGPQTASGAATSSPAAYDPAAGPYSVDHMVAFVSGETYSMAELLRAVRVARVLGYFTGDPVPSDTSPQMPGFQVQMLRRRIDVMLMKQEMARQQMVPPGTDGTLLVQSFLSDTGGTEEQLETQMAASGVSHEDLERWFSDARAVSYFIDQELMAAREPAERDAVVSEWLQQQWSVQDIVVDFYDPDQVLGAPSPVPNSD